jgi:hypothetical protein
LRVYQFHQGGTGLRLYRRPNGGLCFAEAARRLVGNPVLLWVLAAIFILRDLLLMALVQVSGTSPPDTRSFLAGGRAYLSDPRHLYDAATSAMGQTGKLIPPGGLDGFLSPPPTAVLAVPFAVLPEAIGVHLWVLVDGAALLVALLILYRFLRPVGAAAPAFWLVAAYFPPTFGDVGAGQRNGFILLLAVAAVALARRRPVLAGALAGLATAIKFYAGGMLIGPAPRRRLGFAAGLLGSAVVTMGLSYVPIGPDGPLKYLRGVLLPTSSIEDPNCGYVPIHELYSRAVGGAPFLVPGHGDFVVAVSPLHLPLLATILTIATLLAVVAASLWATRRSGWSETYGLALGFSLGALIPSEVYTYQLLPLLPLVLLVTIRAIERRRADVLGPLAVGLLALAPQPCSLPFPNITTIAALVLFATCVAAAPMFRGDA